MLKKISKIIKNKKLSKRFSIIFGSFILLIISISGFLVVTNLGKSQDGRSQASSVSVDYEISVSGSNHAAGEVITSTIKLKPNGGKVSAADLYITYDKSHLQLLTASSISPLRDLKSELVNPGLYRLAFVVNCTEVSGCAVIQTQSDVANVTFKILNEGTSKISLDTTKSLTAETGTDNQSVTGSVNQYTLTSTAAAACSKPADTNGDGRVNGLDYALLFDNWGKTIPGGNDKVDFNCDKVIDGLDYVVLFDNWTID